MKANDKKTGARLQRQATRKVAKEQAIDQLTDQFKDYLMDLSKEQVGGEDLPEITESLDREGEVAIGQKQTVRHWPVVVLIVGGLAGLLLFPFHMQVEGAGTLQPAQRAVLTAPYNGIVEKVYRHYGEAIQAGEAVLVFSTRNDRLDLACKQRELQLTNEQINGYREEESHLEVMLQRKRSMAQANLVSLEEVDRYQLELDRVRSDRLSVQKNQAGLETQISFLENGIRAAQITSAVPGVVMTRNIEELENQFVPEGEKLCEIANPDSLIVQAEVLEKQYRKIKLGQPVLVTFSMYPFKKYRGRVIRIGVNSGPSLRNEKRLAQRGGDIYLHLNNRLPKTFVVDIVLQRLPSVIATGVDAKVRIQVARFRVLDFILGLGLGNHR